MIDSSLTTIDVLGPLNLDQSDEELGKWLLASWLGWQAQQHGFPLDQIPEEWACQVVEATAAIDSDSVKNAALESAFRKTCTGDFEAAGRMLRGFAYGKAEATVHAKLATEAAVVRRGRSEGARKAGATSAANAAAWHEECLSEAARLLASGRSKRELAGILAKRFGKTPTAVRLVLKKAKGS